MFMPSSKIFYQVESVRKCIIKKVGSLGVKIENHF